MGATAEAAKIEAFLSATSDVDGSALTFAA